jgi:hypothetical protein
MSTTLYLKRYQRSGLYHYAKLLPDRLPPLCEVINFLNPVPQLEHREYDLTEASDQIEYKALFEAWEPIPEDEFTRAYKRATAGNFQIYINGKAL